VSDEVDSEVINEYQQIKKEVLEALKQQFRPEFLNRIDEIVIFNALTHEDLMKIVDIQLSLIEERLEEKSLDIELTDRARELLVRRAFDPLYGARPLKRRIQKDILDPLARKMLTGEFEEGDEILVDAVGDPNVEDRASFTFSVRASGRSKEHPERVTTPAV
jgi:ATP-dependent Clp protease ATP-binding subunit ClpB